MKKFDNQNAWDLISKSNNPYTGGLTDTDIHQAKRGKPEIRVTDNKIVPKDWLGDLSDRHILCLAGGGGQQAPLLAAAGAKVTVLDISDGQLNQDRIAAKRWNLEINIMQGDMTDLSRLDDSQFELIIQPISNQFIPDLTKLWSECFRILSYQGILISGFMNPHQYLFDLPLLDSKGLMKVSNRLPFRGDIDLSDEKRADYFGTHGMVEFSHSLEAQIGGQIRAGFYIDGFYEDYRSDGTLQEYFPEFYATKAKKGLRMD
ncbi:class I SAM-dependent methyltransferase [Gudongella sp. DL1XJH-153]|uniref:class I SAM-dependent methyltransferase n=1 Tax=Gudongella sp. DL1XJH-153 TaxID=3409804 RepID=UPI003BB79F8E